MQVVSRTNFQNQLDSGCNRTSWILVVTDVAPMLEVVFAVVAGVIVADVVVADMVVAGAVVAGVAVSDAVVADAVVADAVVAAVEWASFLLSVLLLFYL